MSCDLHDGVGWFSCKKHIGRKTSSSGMEANQIIFLVFNGTYFSTSIFYLRCNLVNTCQSTQVL